MNLTTAPKKINTLKMNQWKKKIRFPSERSRAKRIQEASKNI